MTEQLRKRLEKEKGFRREAESLLDERSIELAQVQAELQQLRECSIDTGLCEMCTQVIASLHEPMKPLLQSMTQLFSQLPPGAQTHELQDEIRKELGRLVSALRSIAVQVASTED